MGRSNTQLIKTADLSINETTGEVFKNKQVIKLPDLSLQTLLVLVKASPETISIDKLIDLVWQDIEVSPETVIQRIALLRKAMGTESKHDTYIKSVRNKGYRWVPPVVLKEPINFSFNKWLVFTIGLMFLAGYLVFDQLKGAVSSIENISTTNISSKVSAAEYTQQAWRYLRKHDAKNNRLAVEMFENLLQKDPENLDGLVGLSFALSHEVSKFNQPIELLSRAKSLAEHATQLYPTQANAWDALGTAHDVWGDMDTAILNYQKSLDLDPDNISAQASIAFSKAIKGQLLEALKVNLQLLNSNLKYKNLQMAENLHFLGFVELADQWYQRADVLSPDNVFVSNQRVRFLISNQRFNEAQLLINQFEAKGIERPETYTLQGILHLIGGEEALATNSFKKALVINPEDFEAQIWALAVSETVENKIQLLDEMWLQKKYYWPIDHIHKTVVYAAMGDHEQVIIGVEDAFNQGFTDSKWLLQLPLIKPYLSNSDFMFWIDQIQQKSDSQRQTLLTADWLPAGFLDPVLSDG